MDVKGELDDEPDPRSPSKRRKPLGTVIKGREKTTGTLETGGSLWAERSESEEGAAINLGTRDATAGASLLLRG